MATTNPTTTNATHSIAEPPSLDSGSEKAHITELENGTQEKGANGYAAGPEDEIENKITFGFVMTMLGFSMTFVTAEVIPLFLITIFTIIAHDLHASAQVIWLISAQLISVGAIVPFVGELTDLIGRKGITLVSLCLTVVSMILIGTTPNFAGMLAGQVLSGVAIGVQLLTSIAAVTELVPVYRRGITIGYVVCGFLPFAPASVYGQLLAQQSWRWVACLIGIWAAVAFIVLAIWYKPPPRHNALGLTKRDILGRIDYIGGFLSISGIVTFLIGINWGGQDYPWKNVRVITTIVIGIILLTLFFVWERFGAKYPMFPMVLAQHKRLFIAICTLCFTSGINYIPIVIFWVIQCYTVFGADYRDAGIYLLPIGFCIAGGAVISAVLMTVFKHHIHLILLGFCIVQTAGLGAMAAVDTENINTAWGPMILGLLGVGGVLLPSQVVFSIISPDDLIGTSVALSIVVRSIGQVIGVSMFYNIFKQKVTAAARANFAVTAFEYGIVDINVITELINTLSAGPFRNYAAEFGPVVNTPAGIAAIQLAGKNTYKDAFPHVYLISIAFGGAAIIACFFLRDINKHITKHVSVHL